MAAAAAQPAPAPASVAYVGLGSNLRDPQAQVLRGFAALAALPQSAVRARSSLYRTAPVGYLDQPDFINAAAALETQLAPRVLLDALLEIERRHGRTREFANAPRTLDLDLLLYGTLQIDEPGLIVPHPRVHLRAFVLAPLSEIAPQGVVPGRGTVADLLRAADRGGVARIEALT